LLAPSGKVEFLAYSLKLPMELLPANTGLYTGLGLCLAAGARCAGAMARWYQKRRCQRQHLLSTLAEFDEQLAQQRDLEKPSSAAPLAWKGYRRFIVQRVVAEADDITSIYLVPEDRRTLPPFLPGQYLTLKVHVPGHNAPLVRCFSLSERPQPACYRITVKAVRPEPGQPFTSRGRVSRYLNKGIRVGDVLESQPPRGEFHLHYDDPRPAVLVAAGIGVTPVLSMASELLHRQSPRKVVLFYGVRNSREHAFHDTLRDLAVNEPRLHYLPCYSRPLPSDRPGHDYLAARRIDAALLQRVLPDGNFPFYICGPGEFMESIVTGLRAWGVAESDLHFEAFGPSTVKKAASTTAQPTAMASVEVMFQQSGQSIAWSDPSQSLLELGEAQGLSLPSGCRAGNCGMCAVRVLAGKVRYEQPPTASIDPGFCLTCVAKPDGEPLTLDA
jgi:ferredoxin-NADP reductase